MDEAKMRNTWTITEKRQLHDDPWATVRLVELVDHGKRAPYVVIDLKQQGAAVVPLTSDGDTFLIRQFRYGAGGDTWEITEGGTRADDSALVTAKQELREEMGITAKRWTSLGDVYPSPARFGSRVRAFLAEDLEIGTPEPDPNEHLAELRRLPLRDAYEMAMRGEITVAITVVALARAWHLVQSRTASGFHQ